MLAQHRLLALIVGAQVLAVEHVWLQRHFLKSQLADRLAMLNHERHVTSTNLERGPAATGVLVPCIAKPRVKEARVVSTKLSGSGIIGKHFSRVGGRDAHALR